MDSATLENVYISKNSHDKLQPDEGVTIAVPEAQSTEHDDEQLANEANAKQQQIDKMTLELLVNKRQYRKYLERHKILRFTIL